MGPALKVLNRQHASLMKMLRQLDVLGEVGTRVLDGSKDNIVASLKHLQPTLTELSDAGDDLPKGLALLASFPFPKEAGGIAKGDFANALFDIKIDLNEVIKSPNDSILDPINLCSITPLDPICQSLDENVLQKLCVLHPKSVLCKGDELLPGVPVSPGGTGGSNSSGGALGLGGLLGGGGGR
jgi:phospholipid/cholesterol/gamma-HCH transport system substrate-binding protein